MMNAIIFAAGKSSRMGTDKALLNIGDTFVLHHLIKKISRISSNIFVVLGENKLDVEKALSQVEELPEVKLIYNENHKYGMFSSIQKGLNAIQNIDPILLQLVDQPFVPIEIYSNLVNFFKSTMKILQPSHKKKAGHPLIINHQFKETILTYSIDANLKDIIQEHSENRNFMNVDDKRVLQNINTLDEYNKELINSF